MELRKRIYRRTYLYVHMHTPVKPFEHRSGDNGRNHPPLLGRYTMRELLPVDVAFRKPVKRATQGTCPLTPWLLNQNDVLPRPSRKAGDETKKEEERLLPLDAVFSRQADTLLAFVLLQCPKRLLHILHLCLRIPNIVLQPPYHLVPSLESNWSYA